MFERMKEWFLSSQLMAALRSSNVAGLSSEPTPVVETRYEELPDEVSVSLLIAAADLKDGYSDTPLTQEGVASY